MGDLPLAGVRVGVAGSGGGDAIAASLSDMGATVVCGNVFEAVAAPAARVEEETRAALAAAPAWVVVSTAAGLEQWLASTGAARDALVGLLTRAPVAARGHRAAEACASHGILPAMVPSSERGRDVADAVAERTEAGDTVVAQVDGGGSPDLVAALHGAGLGVQVVRPYRWAPPADPASARALARRAVAGHLDVVAFTSPPAVAGLFEAAADLGLNGDLERALIDEVKVAALGPATAEALEARGIPVTVYPVRPRTGALLTALAASARLPRLAPLVRLEPATRLARVGDGGVALSELEFSLLAALARRPATTCPTTVLVREVWGDGSERRRLEVLVSRLRARLAPLGVGITSVPKRGYRLVLLADDGPGRPWREAQEAPSLR